MQHKIFVFTTSNDIGGRGWSWRRFSERRKIDKTTHSQSYHIVGYDLSIRLNDDSQVYSSIVLTRSTSCTMFERSDRVNEDRNIKRVEIK